LNTEEVEVVVVADESIIDDRVKRVDNILPDRLATDILADLHILSQAIATEEIVNDHVPLIARHPSCLPGEPFSADNSPV
jgi:hypothetical protein